MEVGPVTVREDVAGGGSVAGRAGGVSFSVCLWHQSGWLLSRIRLEGRGGMESRGKRAQC